MKCELLHEHWLYMITLVLCCCRRQHPPSEEITSCHVFSSIKTIQHTHNIMNYVKKLSYFNERFHSHCQNLSDKLTCSQVKTFTIELSKVTKIASHTRNNVIRARIHRHFDKVSRRSRSTSYRTISHSQNMFYKLSARRR